MTLQPRIPVASLAFPEIPAGMLDGSGNFSGTAAREIYEETGALGIPPDYQKGGRKREDEYVRGKGSMNEVNMLCLGLSIEEHELVDLTEKAYGNQWQGVYPSAGGCGMLKMKKKTMGTA